MIFNLNESKQTESDDRYKEDMGTCVEIFTEGLDIKEYGCIEKVIRIGERTGSRKSLLVKPGSEEEKKTILGRASWLRRSEKYGRV